MPKKKKRKKRPKVELNRAVQLNPDTHLVEFKVTGAPPPEVFKQPVITKPKQHWYDWLAEKIVGV